MMWRLLLEEVEDYYCFDRVGVVREICVLSCPNDHAVQLALALDGVLGSVRISLEDVTDQGMEPWFPRELADKLTTKQIELDARLARLCSIDEALAYLEEDPAARRARQVYPGYRSGWLHLVGVRDETSGRAESVNAIGRWEVGEVDIGALSERKAKEAR